MNRSGLGEAALDCVSHLLPHSLGCKAAGDVHFFRLCLSLARLLHETGVESEEPLCSIYAYRFLKQGAAMFNYARS